MEDTIIEALAESGEARLTNEKNCGTCVVPPNLLSREAAGELTAERILYMDDEEIDLRQEELLRRSTALIDFINSNVGGTADYPVRIVADNRASARVVSDLLKDLQDSITSLVGTQ